LAVLNHMHGEGRTWTRGGITPPRTRTRFSEESPFEVKKKKLHEVAKPSPNLTKRIKGNGRVKMRE